MTIHILNRLCAAFAALAFSLGGFAADSAAVTTVKLAQEQLHHEGFYAGRIDGDLSGAAQAALVQFQLSRGIPASGALDDATLAALRIEREREQEQPQLATGEASAAAGGSGPALVPASPEKKDP
jgi:peptidoglycan hydrolase-like protein with peptidoglycan-binding domain